jgi:hypothetical protein
MKKYPIFILLIICQTFVFSQDKKVMKIAKYIEKGRGTEAKELLDELDSKKEYQSDIYYWYVRTVYYRNKSLTDFATNKDLYNTEITEARKSFERLVELDKTDQTKSFSEYIPQIKKDLYEGVNEIAKKPSNTTQSNSSKQTENNSKTVTLTEIGQGKTKDDAKYNALRNAIERAFGVFISSNTTILNDALIKDEIVSVSSGNIQKFEILSEIQMPDGSYTSIVKATVSVTKLTSFCESKGVVVEFKGGLFAANIKMQELNKKNEEVVISNLYSVVQKITNNSYNYNVVVSDPIKYTFDDNYWKVPIVVEAKMGINKSALEEVIRNSIEGISLSEAEVESYKKQNSRIYSIQINNNPTWYVRSFNSIALLKDLFYRVIPIRSLDFKISNSISNNSWLDIVDCIENHCKPDYNMVNLDGCSYIGNFEKPEIINVNYWFGSDPHYIEKLLIRYRKSDVNNNVQYERDNFAQYDFSIALTESFDQTISFRFINFLSTGNLSKVTEYKATPINK